MTIPIPLTIAIVEVINAYDHITAAVTHARYDDQRRRLEKAIQALSTTWDQTWDQPPTTVEPRPDCVAAWDTLHRNQECSCYPNLPHLEEQQP